MALYVDKEMMIAQGNQIKVYGEQYGDNVKNIYSKIEQLKSSWKGQNASAFDATIMGYKGDLERLAVVLNDIGNDLIGIAGRYQETEDSLADAARGL